MKFRTIEVRGHKVEVDLWDSGEFVAEVDHDCIKASSLDELKKKLDSIYKRKTKKLDVAFALYKEPKWRDKRKFVTGVIYGKHASNGNYLVRWTDGKTKQLSKWELDGLIPMDKLEEYKPLVHAVEDAEKAHKEFIKQHGIDLEATVDKVLEAD